MSAIALVAAQIGQTYSDPARAEIHNVVAAEAITKGQALYQTTSGTFGLCDMTAPAKDEPRGLSLQAASVGEALSMIKYGPVYGFTLAGLAYDALVYASPTVAGGLDTAGQVAVGRVMPATDRSKTKVLFVDFREQPVEQGWLTLPLGFVSAGTYSAPVTSSEAGETFHELWCKCTGAGHVYGRRVSVQVTNPAATTSQAIRAELDLYPATAGSPGGGAAGHFASELGPLATGVDGILAGLNASIILSAATRSVAGKYAAIFLQTEIKAGNTISEALSFIVANDAEAIEADYLIDVELLATGAGNAYVSGTHAGSTVGGVFRVLTSAGVMYLKLYSD